MNVVSLVDHAHATFAELFEDLVVGDDLTNHRGSLEGYPLSMDHG
jgi:hypothetical protein